MILVRKMQLELSILLRSDSSRFRSPAENGIYIYGIHAVESIGWTQSPSGVSLHNFISFIQLFWLTAAVSVALNILADICKTYNSIDAPIKTENFQSKSRYFRINRNTVNIFSSFLVWATFTSLELFQSQVYGLRLHLQLTETHTGVSRQQFVSSSNRYLRQL